MPNKQGSKINRLTGVNHYHLTEWMCNNISKLVKGMTVTECAALAQKSLGFRITTANCYHLRDTIISLTDQEFQWNRSTSKSRGGHTNNLYNSLRKDICTLADVLLEFAKTDGLDENLAETITSLQIIATKRPEEKAE